MVNLTVSWKSRRSERVADGQRDSDSKDELGEETEVGSFIVRLSRMKIIEFQWKTNISLSFSLVSVDDHMNVAVSWQTFLFETAWYLKNVTPIDIQHSDVSVYWR